MISKSITYLRHSDEVVKTVLIGGILSILNFLLIPAFVISGYLVRVLQRTLARGEKSAGRSISRSRKPFDRRSCINVVTSSILAHFKIFRSGIGMV